MLLFAVIRENTKNFSRNPTSLSITEHNTRDRRIAVHINCIDHASLINFDDYFDLADDVLHSNFITTA